MEIRPSWEEALTFPVGKRAGELEVDEEDIRNVESRLVAMVEAEEASTALILASSEEVTTVSMRREITVMALDIGGFSDVLSEAGSKEGLHQQEKKVTHHEGIACASGMGTYRQAPEMEGRL
ncbi:hypothetical protein B296_00028518 [Ensete ventricosum]|uniref:Uncharacterized protein n=1 Tax=Ensete ventricosum TaxID=4639 RepID=A0A426ZTM9_ENSVE|nr:hypothetical protein B296_00028518 [Ensete ventricosum]